MISCTEYYLCPLLVNPLATFLCPSIITTTLLFSASTLRLAFQDKLISYFGEKNVKKTKQAKRTPNAIQKPTHPKRKADCTRKIGEKRPCLSRISQEIVHRFRDLFKALQNQGNQSQLNGHSHVNVNLFAKAQQRFEENSAFNFSFGQIKLFLL